MRHSAGTPTTERLNDPADRLAPSQPAKTSSSEHTSAESVAIRRARRRLGRSSACTDPIVGAILSGWRYDISAISPEMRTDYEQHLDECAHCHHRQNAARTFDVLLISTFTLLIVAFLMAAVLFHRIAALERLDVGHHMALLERIDVDHVYLLHSAMAISLEALAIGGLVISTVLWILVAIATPLPSFFSGVLEERIPSDLRQRFARRHA